MVSVHDGHAGDNQQSKEHFPQRVKELEDALMEHWEHNTKEKDEQVPTWRVPAKFIEAEWAEHRATHTFPRPWCKFCMMGRGNRRAHRADVTDTEAHDGGPNNLSMEYMDLNDEGGTNDQPQLALVDHNQGRVFAYPTPRKGVTGEVEWVPDRVTKDIENMGYKDVNI